MASATADRRTTWPSAARRLERAGTEEVVAFVGDVERIFCGLHLPPKPQPTAVVVCPSIGNELVRRYRGDVDLARVLARAGSAVVRLQYRGTGNSDGDPKALTRDSMLDDVRAAADTLVARSSAHQLLFVGTRFGALVAAAAATDHDDASVALIDPVVDADAYFREGLRAKRMHAVTNPGATATAPEETLARQGWIDVFGAALHDSTRRSWLGSSVVSELGGNPRPVLVVASRSGRAAAACRALGDTLVGRRFPVELVAVDMSREQGWYLDESELLKIGRDGIDANDDAERTSTVGSIVHHVTRWVDGMR